MSLSCLRLRVLMLFGIVFFGYVLVSGGRHVATGLPDTSPLRLLAVAGIGLLLVGLMVLLVGGLTARVQTDDAGVHLMWFSRRRSFGWHEINGITLARNHRMWVPALHTSRGTHRVVALMCPVIYSLRWSEREFTEPPPSTPGSLRKPYLRLREEWRRRRSATSP